MPRFCTAGEESRRRQAARLFAIGGLFAMGYGIVLCRAVIFHLRENAQLEQVALRQYRTAVHQSIRRGKILDSAGRELAINIQAESLYANPLAVSEPAKYARDLSRILNLNQKTLEEHLRAKRKFAWVKRRVTPEEARAVAALGLEGMYSMDESYRAYPNGKLASTVLGAVGFDAEPLGGIELAYNDLLVASANTPGKYQRDARGHLYLSPSSEEGEVKLSEIGLTIDKTLQYTAERELADAVNTTNARGGVALVVDAQSGEILAMASFPAFDPNHYGDADVKAWKNKAITDAYEPGSTFKVMVVASVLDHELVHPEDVFDCGNGKLVIGANTIRDSHPHGRLTVEEIIKVSSNIGAAKVGALLSTEKLYQALGSFGFGRTTGLGLPAESPGILSSSSKWSDIQRATIAFGQGVSATPLQMTMAFAAIANGGEMLRPRIVKRVMNEQGEELPVPDREVISRPIRPETARVMVEMLKKVTKPGGTGTLAASNEYAVAGKTGTAQKPDEVSGGYGAQKYYSSFIGFAPADAPKLVVYVGIDEPTGGAYYGGQVAAPAFRRVMEESLHYLKVPVSSPASTTAPVTRSASESIGTEEKRHAVVVAEGEKWRIPDFHGFTMREVLEALGEAEVKVRFQGSGVVVEQQPLPGSLVPSGVECKVTFRSLL